MLFDLDKPRLQRRHLIEMVPLLTAKTMQNWIDVGHVDTGPQPCGKGRRYSFSPLMAVKLAFVVDLVRLGIQPTPAFSFAEMIEETVRELWASEPEEFPADPDKPICLKSWKADSYRRALIVQGNDGPPRMDLVAAGDRPSLRLWLPTTYITVEVDILALRVLKRAHRVMARLPAFAPPREEEA